MTSRSRFLAILSYCFLFSGIVWSYGLNARVAEQQQVVSVLTLNLARFTDWPETARVQNSELNLCVIGDNIVQRSFEIIDRSLVNDKRLQVINISRLRNIEPCLILYISELDRHKLMQLLLELENKPVLTIGEGVDFVKAGGMVGFENVDGKIQLNINLRALKRSGLVISSRILKLARIIE